MDNNKFDYLDNIPMFAKTISQKFHKQTKINALTRPVSPKKWPETWKKVYFKAYPRLPAIKLPKPLIDSNYSLKRGLYARRSVRAYSSQALKLQDISNLLYYSAGIRKSYPTWERNRFYPSAGARYPLEVYPILLNVEGLKPGIYHYYLKSHALEELLIGGSVKTDVLKHFNFPWMKHAGMIIATSGVFYRNQVKYGERGYRHVLTEVGHLCQNIYLLCPVFGLGCCNSGGFLDDALNELIDIDGVQESVISVMFVGKI